MRDHILKSARTLAACLLMVALAQPVAAQQQREGSWELSLSGGAMYVDGTLTDFLGRTGFANDTAPGHIVPAGVVRLGYNINKHVGFSGGTGFGIGSGVKYLSPFGDFTYTANLNAGTSPFVLIGTQFTRITGNERVTHPTWGARAGLGVRHMLSDNLALRLEGRVAFEHYAETARKTTFNPIVTLGLSYFTAGRHAPPPAPCPACVARVRVDTVWQTVTLPPPPLPPIVLRDTLVIEGINFAFDSSALTPESHFVLDRLADALQKPEWVKTRWEIAGHTSSVGTHEYNMTLSQRRAESVRAYLVSRGVADWRLVPRGYGETDPKYPNDSEGRNWRNRRVEMRRIRP